MESKYKMSDTGTLSIYDKNTNSVFGSFECFGASIENNSVDKINEQTNTVLPFMHVNEMTLTFSVNEPIPLKQLFTIGSSGMPEAYDIQYNKIVQVKHHKKKRINKKWIKKYGYKNYILDAKGWKINIYTDGSIQFIK